MMPAAWPTLIIVVTSNKQTKEGTRNNDSKQEAEPKEGCEGGKKKEAG